MFSQKNLKLSGKKINFFLLNLNFPCYSYSIDLKRQSEHSGLRPDTSSLVFYKVKRKFVFLAHYIRFTGRVQWQNLMVKVLRSAKKIHSIA